ncbi:glycoside hydrolase family 3 C-terminal domain-containing protein [Polaribacter sp. Hel1_85]|uniref:glycoside hydrolase family 3 C-terminal domain-containing protein n=1 Tax=Polaribacter sp. Hel1_85 TaxID=1250005 RepID=UPI00052E27F6|nr:glycoside hydrolase family 3 C-terminal domain-containing protein [Polaribacter sp. Hel1_85]KGL63126.1 beta-glucosidase B, GH3 family [Polaribacter sp. Hel1_85]
MKLPFKNNISLLTFILSLHVLFTNGQNKIPQIQLEKHQTSTAYVEAKIDSIIAVLTLKEKIALIHAQSKFSTKGVSRLGIPEVWMSDGPHGVREEILWDDWGEADWTNDAITAFPALTCLAASFNPELSGEYGFNLGEEARYREKDVLLGPGVNIYRTPFNGRNFEYLGEDPFLASTMVVPYVKGVQKNGVAACVKHYVLNNQEHLRDKINVEVSDRALHEIYLPAFKAAVQKGKVWSLMGAYNKFRGQYTTHHKILNKILKTDWGFDGVVISDWGSAHNTKEAALYGLDMEMGTGTDGLGVSKKDNYNYYYLANPFLEAIKKGELTEELLNDKVRRVLRLIYRTNLNPNRALGKLNNKEHHEVARKVGVEGIVLLKNEDNFFPIKDKKGVTIAIIGENATRNMTRGGGSSQLKPLFEVSPLEGLKARYKNATIIHTMGYESGASAYNATLPATLNQDSLYVKAVEVAKKADIVLFIGGLNKSYHQDTEGGDRKVFELPYGQEKLLNGIYDVNKEVGFLLVTGNAVEMPWVSKTKGILQTWYLGSMAGHSIADIVSGDVNPSGKLPFSFPKKLKDNAAHSFGVTSYPGDDVNQYYKEDILVGYRWFDTKKIVPQYAFGYGLSYTDFVISDVIINQKKYTEKDKIEITLNISNTGNREGAEVIQLYVGKHKSKVKRALKELKGFKKVYLDKGSEKTITISIDTSELAYYNTEISDWSVEKGTYYLYIGNASNNIVKKIRFNLF